MDDEEIYEMFLEMMERLDDDDPCGRTRIISKNPRYAANSFAATKQKPSYIER